MMPEELRQNNLKDAYRVAITARDFEITQLVQRNNFFMVFQGVLLAGLLQASNSGHIHSMVIFIVCLAGLLISILQFFMASGAKFWQERWEAAVEKIEMEIFPKTSQAGEGDLFRLFSSPNPELTVQNRKGGKGCGWLVKRKSPSRLPMYAALIFVATWLFLWLYTFKFCITGFPIS